MVPVNGQTINVLEAIGASHDLTVLEYEECEGYPEVT